MITRPATRPATRLIQRSSCSLTSTPVRSLVSVAQRAPKDIITPACILPRLLTRRSQASLARFAINTANAYRVFSTTPVKKTVNRTYNSVRSAEELQTYLLSSTSSRIPLLTLWTASYCPSCRAIKPLLKDMIEKGVGEPEGGVNYCEVEFDAPDILNSGAGMTYMINSLPSLVVFDRGEIVARESDVKKLKERDWLRRFVEEQAKRRGDGTGMGGPGGSGSGIFGGLFGSSQR